MADGYNPETGHTRLTKIDGEWLYVTERDYVEMNAYDDGVLRWKSNDRVVPYDVLRTAGYDKDFITKSLVVEEEEHRKAIREWANAQREFEADTSPEAMAIKREQHAERVAAFGEGAEVVDVFTGQRYRT